MMKLYSLVAFAILAIVPFGHAGASQAELRYKTDFTADDFKKRREAIYEEIGDNYAIIQAAEEIQGFIVFRQSNTFYYLSGLEVPSRRGALSPLFKFNFTEFLLSDIAENAACFSY